MKFAKIFDDDKLGQILINLTRNDHGKSIVQFKFAVPDVHETEFEYEYPTREQAEEAFDSLDAEKAAEVVTRILRQIGEAHIQAKKERTIGGAKIGRAKISS
jgi:hypothetical protein